MFKIIYDSPISDVDEDGHCSPNRGIIRINNILPKTEQEETLLHEVLHGCCAFVGIDTEKEKLSEEEWITRISPILFTVLKENPSLLNSSK